MYVFYDVSSHYPELNEVVGKMVQRMLCHDAHIRLESNAGFKLLQIEIFHFSETSDLIQKGLEVKNTVSYKYSRTKIEKKNLYKFKIFNQNNTYSAKSSCNFGSRSI
jgi:hypothetical protein